MDLGLQYEELKCYSWCVLDTVVRREGDPGEHCVRTRMPDIGTVVTSLPPCFCAAVAPAREASPARDDGGPRCSIRQRKW